MKEKYDDLKVSSQKKDNVIEVFLFFLNNVQVFLKHYNHNHTFNFDLYTLKGVLDSVEFKRQITNVETMLFNLSNDIEHSGFNLLRNRHESNLSK